MKEEKSCGAIIRDDGEYLVIKQRQGHWDFPKGHVEEGESEKETARREVKEETDVDIAFVDGFRETIQYQPRKGVEKEVVFFLAEPDSRDVSIQEEELHSATWKPFDDAMSLLTYDTAKTVLEKAKNYVVFSQYKEE